MCTPVFKYISRLTIGTTRGPVVQIPLTRACQQFIVRILVPSCSQYVEVNMDNLDYELSCSNSGVVILIQSEQKPCGANCPIYVSMCELRLVATR